MRYYFYAILAAILGGTIGMFVKLIGDEIHFMTLNFYRVFFAFIFLLMVVPFIDKNAFKITKKSARDYFIAGLFLALSIFTFTTANVFAPIHNVSLLANISPFFVLIFAYFLLKEKITKIKMITLVIAVIGLIIMNPFRFEWNVGNALALSNGLFFGFYLVWARKQDKIHGIGDVMWFFFFASLLLLPSVFIFGFGSFSVKILIYVILVGILSTGLQHLFTNLSLQKIEAEIDSIIKVIFAPLVAVILAVLVIKESLDFRIIIGGAVLILAGIYLESHNKKLKARGD